MEQFQEHFNVAKQKIYVADHMLSTTYALLKDTKILLAILENVHDAYTMALKAMLEHERLFKRIPPYNKTDESELNLFKLKVQNKYNFDASYSSQIDKLRAAIRAHKEAPVEFSKDDSYIIASDSYDLTKIKPDDLKKDISMCKTFISHVQRVIQDA